MSLRSGKNYRDNFSTLNLNLDMAEEFSCVPFDPDSGMLIENWLIYFNKTCQSSKLSEDWKCQNVSKFLKGSALTTYVNHCQDCTSFEELTLILTEQFVRVNIPNFSDFANLKLQSFDHLEEYFRKKLECGRKLGLTENLILQGLTDGLKPEYRNILIVNAPTNTTEWFRIVSQLNVTTENSSYQHSRNNFSSYNSRDQFYNVPHINQPRHWVKPAQSYQPRGFAPRAPTNHMHQNFPPRPCRICTNKQILNAYHWERDCTFRQTPGVGSSDQI